MRAHVITAGKISNTIVVEALDALPGVTLIDADLHPGNAGDLWDGTTVSPPVKPLADLKAAKLTALATLAKEKLNGGVMVNGIRIGTDAEARGLLALGKLGGKPARKIVTSSGQKANLTGAQFNAIVDAIDNFGQAIMDRHYDLIGLIEAASNQAALDAVDINSGWPA